jgi:hypothetical protein
MSKMDSRGARTPVYGPIHKLHRYALASAVIQLGRTDFSVEEEARAAAKLVREQIAFGREHLRNEDRHLHPLIAKVAAMAHSEVERGHDGHERDFRELEALAGAAESGNPSERVAAGAELYLAFARFVARDFDHMDFEERAVEPLLHDSYSDEEIERSHSAIIAETSADEMERLAGIASRALNGTELKLLGPLFDTSASTAAAA